VPRGGAPSGIAKPFCLYDASAPAVYALRLVLSTGSTHNGLYKKISTPEKESRLWNLEVRGSMDAPPRAYTRRTVGEHRPESRSCQLEQGIERGRRRLGALEMHLHQLA